MFCGAAGENCRSADLTLSEPLRPNHVRRSGYVDVTPILALTPTTEHGWSRPGGQGDEGQGAERGRNGNTQPAGPRNSQQLARDHVATSHGAHH